MTNGNLTITIPTSVNRTAGYDQTGLRVEVTGNGRYYGARAQLHFDGLGVYGGLGYFHGAGHGECLSIAADRGGPAVAVVVLAAAEELALRDGAMEWPEGAELWVLKGKTTVEIDSSGLLIPTTTWDETEAGVTSRMMRMARAAEGER